MTDSGALVQRTIAAVLVRESLVAGWVEAIVALGVPRTPAAQIVAWAIDRALVERLSRAGAPS